MDEISLSSSLSFSNLELRMFWYVTMIRFIPQDDSSLNSSNSKFELWNFSIYANDDIEVYSSSESFFFEPVIRNWSSMELEVIGKFFNLQKIERVEFDEFWDSVILV